MQIKNKQLKYYSKLDKDRMNEDLNIASELGLFLSKLKYIVILDGGYGVDAVCTGKITRFHHDLDLVVVVDDIKRAQVESSVLEGLYKLSNIMWESKPTLKNWIWLREIESDNKKSLRQINIHILNLKEKRTTNNYVLIESGMGVKYKLYIQKSKLSDLSGNSYIFNTLSAEEYLANKIRLIPKYSPDWSIRERDLYDLRQLCRLRNVNLKESFSLLNEYFANTNQRKGANSETTVLNFWNKFTNKYPNILSKKQITTLHIQDLS